MRAGIVVLGTEQERHSKSFAEQGIAIKAIPRFSPRLEAEVGISVILIIESAGNELGASFLHELGTVVTNHQYEKQGC